MCDLSLLIFFIHLFVVTFFSSEITRTKVFWIIHSSASGFFFIYFFVIAFSKQFLFSNVIVSLYVIHNTCFYLLYSFVIKWRWRTFYLISFSFCAQFMNICFYLIWQHRLTTLLNYDRIIVIENGKIVEDGTPDELRHKVGGKFSSMLYSSIQSNSFYVSDEKL